MKRINRLDEGFRSQMYKLLIPLVIQNLLNAAVSSSDVAALERMEILRDLRMAKFDVLIGINLLREGLDLPEVSLVAILDADKEGFLRS